MNDAICSFFNNNKKVFTLFVKNEDALSMNRFTESTQKVKYLKFSVLY